MIAINGQCFGKTGQQSDLAGDLVRVPEVVAVEEGQHFAVCLAGPVVAGSRLAGVGLAQDAYPVAIAFQHLWRGVCGAVVDDDDFQVWVGLRQYAVEGVSQESCGVISGNDDADQRGGGGKGGAWLGLASLLFKPGMNTIDN